MQRITLTLEDDFADSLEEFMQQQNYRSRSEAMRDLMRAGMQQATSQANADGSAVATLSYVYSFEVRQLAKRLAQLRHQQHALSVATTNMQLDHHSCLEVAMLRGDARDIRRYADSILAERGVRHGQLHLVAVEPERTTRHDDSDTPFEHVHLKVRDGF